MPFILAFFASVGLSGKLLGQKSVRDSLLVALSLETDPARKADLLNDLAFEFFDFNDTLATSYATEALEVSTDARYTKGIKYATLLLGIGQYGKGNLKSALDMFAKSLQIKAEGASELEVYALSLSGESLTLLAKYDSAEILFNKGLAIAKRSNAYWLPRVYTGFARILSKKWENQKALVYLDSAAALLDRESKDFRWLELLSISGEVYANLLQNEKSFEAYHRMCEIASELDDIYHQAKCMLNQSRHFYDQGDYAQALKFAQADLELTKKYVFPVQQVALYSQISSIYVQLGEYDLALNYLFKSIDICESIGLSYDLITIFDQIAWVYKDEGKLELAMQFANKALDLAEKIGTKREIAFVLNTKGLIYLVGKKYELSILTHQQALKLRQEIGHKLGVIASLFNEALVYEQQGQLEKALQLQLKVDSLNDPNSSPVEFILSYQRIARLLINLNRLQEAEMYIEKAVAKTITTSTMPSERTNSLLYAMLYEKKGNFEVALSYRKKYEELNDSIFSQSSVKKIAEMQAIYELQQKENEIDVLKTKQSQQQDQLLLQGTEIQNQRRLIFIVVVFLTIVTILAIVLIRLISKLNHTQKDLANANANLSAANREILDTNKTLEDKVNERTKQLSQAYIELDTFFYRSSHDFRRPLTTLIGLADVAKITVKDNQAIELFEMVRLTAQNLDKMLFKLQSISNVGAMELSKKQVLLETLIDLSLDKHATQIKKLGVDVEKCIEVHEPIHSYPTLITIILDNLIENALDFSSHIDPQMKISVYGKEGSVFLTIEDNGDGIHDKYKHDIFTMYFKGSERSKGNGLGLYIANKAAEKLSASITVETAYAKGSIFKVELPNTASSVTVANS